MSNEMTKLKLNEYESIMSKAADKMSELYDTIAVLRAQNAELIAALERIADMGENGSMSYTLADIARAILAKYKE